MNENELINKTKEGDVSSFKVLIELYQDMVLNTAFGFLKNKDDSEDITQDVFIKVYKTISKFKGDSKFSTWLYRITINESLNFLKSKKRRNLFFIFSSENEDQVYDIPDTGSNSPSEVSENTERRKILYKAIDSLAENQKIAYTLSKIDGMSYSEIAEIMGTTISSVESLLNRAKKKLKLKLEKFYKNEMI